MYHGCEHSMQPPQFLGSPSFLWGLRSPLILEAVYELSSEPTVFNSILAASYGHGNVPCRGSILRAPQHPCLDLKCGSSVREESQEGDIIMCMHRPSKSPPGEEPLIWARMRS